MLKFSLIQLSEALAQVPYIVYINTQNDYELALKLMNELVDDYDAHKQLIELLTASIKHWEDSADEFATFNMAVAELETRARNHRIENANAPILSKMTDLPELGSKPNVSKQIHIAKS